MFIYFHEKYELDQVDRNWICSTDCQANEYAIDFPRHDVTATCTA